MLKTNNIKTTKKEFIGELKTPIKPLINSLKEGVLKSSLKVYAFTLKHNVVYKSFDIERILYINQYLEGF